MKKYLFGLMALLLISAPAFAGDSRSCCDKKKVKKVCYAITSASCIPMPCDRLGQIPTTAVPMLIIGNH